MARSGIVLLGHRITEIRKNAIAEISCDQATAGLDDFRRLTQICGKDVIVVLGVEALGEGPPSPQDRKTSR